ncbi:MAG: DNA methyltransferase [Methanosarcinaceae archaeon]
MIINYTCGVVYIKTRKSAKLETILKNRLDDEILISKPEFANLVNFSDYKGHPIYRWFKYREGYSTSLIKTLLARKKNQTCVLDPFCGSGTTLITSNELGFDSVG